MPILSNVEIWHVKCDPERPNPKFNKKNPTWETQGRTTSKEVKKQWEDLGLSVKAVREDEEGPVLYYRINLRRKSIKENGQRAEAPEVVNGAREPINPNTVGNGSIANIRIFQYNFTDDDGKSGKATVLMGLQLVKHIIYKPKPRDDGFQEIETTTIAATESEDDDDNDSGDDDDFKPTKTVTSSTPSVTPKVPVAGF